MKNFFIIFFILNFNSLVFANDNQDLKASTSINNQLKILQNLYRSGVLSGYEYEKEKKKILDN